MIEIVNPGLLTTVQDGGRTGYQAYGVPVCGAMDWLSLARANILAGNPRDEAALELTGLGPVIRFDAETVFAISGADFSAKLNGAALDPNGAYLAHKEDVLEFGAAKGGFRAYFSIAGGFDLPKVMESRSTCLAAGFGGFEGRALKKGDRIGFRAPQLWLRGLPERRIVVKQESSASIRVVPGPQNDAFSEDGLQAFFSGEYKLTNQCDRMGCRLEGPNISLKDGVGPNILSDGIVMGSIQVPNGQPIIMMADRQTTGGYVKLGTVATADLPKLAQKRPGDSVFFEEITVQQAQKLRRDLLRRLRALEEALDWGGIW